jgi:hypothetical protein
MSEETMSNPFAAYMGNYWPRRLESDYDHDRRQRQKLFNHAITRGGADRLDPALFVHRYGSSPALYPKPNGGKRTLPSVYVQLRNGTWLNAVGEYLDVVGMNPGHIENCCKLLNESHGNVVAKCTELLGRMANHFANQPAIVEQLEAVCRRMQEVDVSEMYPIMENLRAELHDRPASPRTAVDPEALRDTLDLWSNDEPY